MSLHKLRQLSRQLFVKLFGSASDGQRGRQRGVIVLADRISVPSG